MTYHVAASCQAAWDDRGHGTLTVRQQASEDDSPASANIVFTTESGRILVNGGVYKGIQVKQVRLLLCSIQCLYLALDLNVFVALGTRRQDKLLATVQMKKPIMVITNLTLAAEEGAGQEVKLTMMLFNLGTSEKASKFMKVVDDVKP